MGTAVIGALRVTLGLDSAEFVSGMQAAQGRMSAMSKGFAGDSNQVRASAKALGLSVSGMSREFAALKGLVDPAGVALGRYQQQTKLLREAMRLGIITQDQFKASVKAAHAAYRQAGTGIVGASGAMQAGMTQLGFQANDFFTQIGAGTSPMRAFTTQIGQATQAITLMAGTTTKFGRFMSGPWGIALSIGTVALAAFLPKLLETTDALEDATDASAALGEAQGLLGDAFDETTGKINSMTGALAKNTEAAILNLKIMSMRLKVEAQAQREQFGKTLRGATRPPLLSQFGASFAHNADVFNAMGDAAKNSEAGRILKSVQAGKLDSAAAFSQLQKTDFRGIGISRNQAVEALQTIVDAQRKELIAGDIDKSLAAGQLSGQFTGLIKPEKTKKGPNGPKGPKDKTAQADARYQDELGRLRVDLLREEAAYTDNIKLKRDAELAAIDEDVASYERDVSTREGLSQTKKQELIAARKAVAEAERANVEDEASRRLAEKRSALLETDLKFMAADAELRSEMADTSEDRLKAELELFDLNERLRRAELDRILATEDIGSIRAQQARDEKDWLDRTQAARRGAVARRNETPSQRFARESNLSADQINEAIDQIKINGLERLNDELADAIINFKSLREVVSSVVKSILADLLRLQIQQTIIKPLAAVLGLGGGAGGALSTVGASLFGGGGAGPSASLLASATSTVNSGLPFFAAGTNFAPGGLAVVGESGPELVNLPRGSQVIPANDTARMMGGAVHIHVNGAMSPQQARETGQQVAYGYRRAMNGPVRSG